MVFMPPQAPEINPMMGPTQGPPPPPSIPQFGGMPSFPPQPTLPTTQTFPAEPEPPSKSFQETALKYVGSWCKASRAFVRSKVDHWKMLEALYLNQLGISDWQAWREGTLQAPGDSRTTPPMMFTGGVGTAESSLWQSQYVHSPSNFVDNFTDNAFSQIFGGSEWLSIITESPEKTTQDPNTPSQFTVAFKLQQLLMARLENAGIHIRLYEAIQSCCMLGTVFGKVFWYARNVPKFSWQVSLDAVSRIKTPDLVYECPIIQTIPLDRVLPDRAALHTDLQRWRGIGHTVDRSWEDICESYDAGDYNLPKKDFTDRWPKDSERGGLAGQDNLYADQDAYLEDDETGWFQIWEWHGKIPHDGKQIECCATIITEKNTDDPIDGVLARLTTRPILACGLRPFVVSPFIPRTCPGGLGVGLISRQEDILYQLSQFVGQAQDIVRLSANPIYQIDFASPAYQEIKKNGGILSPGMILPIVPGDPNSGLQAAKLPPYPTQEIATMVQFLSGKLERDTSVSDTQQGISQGKGKTATEASILQTQGAVPTKARVQIFCRSFLEPALNLALAMLQEFSTGDQQIVVRGTNGQDIPITVTTDELQEGKYRAVVTLLRQDHTTIAKAQSLERALPLLQNLQPMLQAEGVQISFNEIVQRFVELVGIEGADRIIRQLSPQEQQQIQQQQMMAQMGVPSSPPGGGPPQMGGGGPPPSRPPMPPGPPPNGPIRQPPRLVENGGPMGQAPTDDNAIAQLLQMQALSEQGGMP
jgi:hypothetical protein